MSNIPLELFTVILEYLNDIEVNRYFGIYKKVNMKKFKHLESICWTKYRRRHQFISARRGIQTADRNPTCLGEIHTYYFPSISKNQQNIIRVDYGWKELKDKKVYVKSLEFHTLKDDFDELDDHCQLLKLKKRAESSLWGDRVKGCYWDNLVSVEQQRTPFL